MDKQASKIKGSLWGSVIGDALGVPHEFKMREEFEANPVNKMEGFGTHDQPPGTWSDDTSLSLCTMISLSQKGLDFNDQMSLFLKWLEEGFCTPHGKVFDIGDSTMESILNYKRGVNLFECGGRQVWQNGNGSLMRILPLSINLKNQRDEVIIEETSKSSSLTHGHNRSQLTCSFYSLFLKRLLNCMDFSTAYLETINVIGPKMEAEKEEFSRILDQSILKGERISSTGYVIHSLEASLYCVNSTNSFKDAVLKAVNLGFDTDTTAAITGGIAGAIYGYESIPSEWINVIVRKDFIEEVINGFIQSLRLCDSA